MSAGKVHLTFSCILLDAVQKIISVFHHTTTKINRIRIKHIDSCCKCNTNIFSRLIDQMHCDLILQYRSFKHSFCSNIFRIIITKFPNHGISVIFYNFFCLFRNRTAGRNSFQTSIISAKADRSIWIYDNMADFTTGS